MFDSILASESVQEALSILQTEFPLAIWETFYVTILSTLFASIIGLPLGVLVTVGGRDEAAQSMGATPFQVIVKVLIPESVPSLISNGTIAITTILGYSAMSGIIGGGGLGKIAINYGYYRYKTLVMILAVILLIIMVQVFQSLGTYLVKKLDRRSFD